MKKNEVSKIDEITRSIENLAKIVNTVMDVNIEIAKELKTHKEECVSLCNRINELELSMERKREPLVRPVVRRANRMSKNGEVLTPYPKKRHPLVNLYYKIRRRVNAYS